MFDSLNSELLGPNAHRNAGMAVLKANMRLMTWRGYQDMNGSCTIFGSEVLLYVMLDRLWHHIFNNEWGWVWLDLEGAEVWKWRW